MNKCSRTAFEPYSKAARELPRTQHLRLDQARKRLSVRGCTVESVANSMAFAIPTVFAARLSIAMAFPPISTVVVSLPALS